MYVERWEGDERWPDVELLTHLTQKRLHFLSFTIAQDRTHWIVCMASRPYSSPADVSADEKTKPNKKIPSPANQMGYLPRLSFCFVFPSICPPFAFFNSMSGSPLDSKLFFFIFLFIITTRQRSLTRTFLYHSDLLYTTWEMPTQKDVVCVCCWVQLYRSEIS